MNKNKLVLPIAILLASIILGGFYYASQSNKQQSIEKQVESNGFEKKVECAKFIPQLKEQAVELGIFFIEIFYSEKAGSCLYIMECRDNKQNLSTKSFSNALTNKTIKFETFSYQCGNSYMGCNHKELNAEQIENNRKQDMRNKNFDELVDSYR